MALALENFIKHRLHLILEKFIYSKILFLSMKRQEIAIIIVIILIGIVMISGCLVGLKNADKYRKHFKSEILKYCIVKEGGLQFGN